MTPLFCSQGNTFHWHFHWKQSLSDVLTILQGTNLPKCKSKEMWYFGFGRIGNHVPTVVVRHRSRQRPLSGIHHRSWARACVSIESNFLFAEFLDLFGKILVQILFRLFFFNSFRIFFLKNNCSKKFEFFLFHSYSVWVCRMTMTSSVRDFVMKTAAVRSI